MQGVSAKTLIMGVTKSNRSEMVKDYNWCTSVYLPMYRDGEDGPDVGQHCFELLRILLEAHFCQHQRLANILDENTKSKYIK